jgi:cyclic beta-1,2-glucan synthetase
VSAAAPEAHAPPLEAAAADLAQRHRLSREKPRSVPLLERLDEIPAWLARARARLSEPDPALAKASDWLLDNDYLVERAVRQIREDLPGGFYARLPRLDGGEEDGLPRVFSLAHALLHASRLQLSLDGATRFAAAYQDGAGALTIAELWAFPTLLRIACLELLVTALSRLVPRLPAPAPATLSALAPAGLDDTDSVARGRQPGRDRCDLVEGFLHARAASRRSSPGSAGVYPRMDSRPATTGARSNPRRGRRLPRCMPRSASPARGAPGVAWGRSRSRRPLADRRGRRAPRSLGCRPRGAYLRTQLRRHGVLYALLFVRHGCGDRGALAGRRGGAGSLALVVRSR